MSGRTGKMTAEALAARGPRYVLARVTTCVCGCPIWDHNKMGLSRGRPLLSACNTCPCTQWRPKETTVIYREDKPPADRGSVIDKSFTLSYLKRIQKADSLVF